MEKTNQFNDRFSKAVKLIQNSKNKEGLDILEELREKHPGEIALRNLLGIVYFNMGRYEESYTELSEAVKIDPDNEKVQYNLTIVMNALMGEPICSGCTTRGGACCNNEDAHL